MRQSTQRSVYGKKYIERGNYGENCAYYKVEVHIIHVIYQPASFPEVKMRREFNTDMSMNMRICPRTLSILVHRGRYFAVSTLR